MCNFYHLIKQIDSKYLQNSKQAEMEKDNLMKNALEVYGAVAKNQNILITSFNKNTKDFIKAKEEKIKKFKEEKILEKRKIEEDIENLEKKISRKK